MVHYHIIPCRRHPIKDTIWPRIDLVNRGPSLPPIGHKQVTQPEPHSLWIDSIDRVQRRSAERCHAVICCPILAIRPQVHFKDLLPIVVGEEEMVVTGVNRYPGGFIGEV